MPKTDFINRLAERMDRMDASSLHNYLQRLARERGFLETIFSTIREGVVVLDRTLGITYANHAARHLLGLQEDYIGQRIHRYLREMDWAPFLQAGPGQWQSITRQEMEIHYPEHRHISFYAVPVTQPGEDRNAPVAALVLQDVTEAVRQMEQQVESEKSQALTLLAAGVAHELGNPLNSLNIQLQLLARSLRRIDDPELAGDVQGQVAIARQEVERLDGIIRNFLKAVRPAPLEKSLLKVETVLLETLHFLAPEIEDRQIEVRTEVPGDLPPLHADPGQLKQAFFNLARNAIQAMPEGGRLEVSCQVRDDFLDIRFADTGPGIPAHILPHILDPYYTTKEDGTGLGLMIVERIVRLHGGKLNIESREGCGAAFTLRLPLHEKRPRLLENPAVAPGGETPENHR